MSLMARQWIKAGTFAALDQAWLSAINLGISLAFIRWGEKTEYGIYLLLLTPIYLMQGIQNALFLSPFSTLFPAKPVEERTPLLQVLIWGTLAFSLIAGALAAIGLFIYQLASDDAIQPKLAGAFSLAVLGLLSREAMRSLEYGQGRAGQALLGDLIFGTVLLGATLICIVAEDVSAVWILIATGIGGLLPLARSAIKRVKLAFLLPKKELGDFWSCGRWALIGVGLTWVTLNSYPYVSASAFGVAAVADINAARLFLMPFVLCIPAWANLARPRFSKWMHEKNAKNVRNFSLYSTLIGSAAISVYVIAIYFAYPVLEELLGKSYTGLLPLVLAWSVYFLFNLARAVFMATLMVDEAGYKKLSMVSTFALFLLVPTMAVAIRFDAVWIVGGLAFIEFAQMLIVGRIAMSYWEEPA